eukprot:TRINITY_DN10816_c1_g1_i1.p2 TRINITY_DN10816_c1_g1~~TRINITY_DN10816_c1_g1_i1.p2  ORF type:complete len:210 (-),score=143.41 TRINITY_DN10816_c1_g1_i1:204-833(-)
MSFWGQIVSSAEKVKVQVPEDANLVVSQACVDDKEKGANTLFVETEGFPAIAICTLTSGKTDNSKLDLVFEAGREIEFSVKGKGAIHLAGYFSLEDGGDEFGEDEDFDSDDELNGEFDSDDDEEEELEGESDEEPALVKGKRPAPQTAENPKKKQAVAAAPQKAAPKAQEKPKAAPQKAAPQAPKAAPQKQGNNNNKQNNKQNNTPKKK